MNSQQPTVRKPAVREPKPFYNPSESDEQSYNEIIKNLPLKDDLPDTGSDITNLLEFLDEENKSELQRERLNKRRKEARK